MEGFKGCRWKWMKKMDECRRKYGWMTIDEN